MASSSSTRLPKYHVFLSFRGEDTRYNFTAHLHTALSRYGIIAFIDDQLRRGEQISPALLQAIEDSRFSIIIFSQNYASSRWCLDELSKILESVHRGKHTALPVFLEVDPSYVRHQKGSYEEAFKKHEEAYKNNMEKVRKWRDDLKEASGYSGWHITRDRSQPEVIKEIVAKIVNEVPRNPSSSNKIGIDSHIKAMLALLCLESPEVRMVGIWGMPGIGKTTIAEAIYERIRYKFEGSCFLPNVREKSKRNENIKMELLSEIFKEKNQSLRFCNRGNSIEEVLRSTKVLIVLDDVDDIKQLEELAGNHDWFHLESRIIVTTRNRRLLEQKDVDEIYEAKELERDEAHMLFSQHAFKDKSFQEGFEELCHHFLDYAKGHPLTIIILGRLLYKRDKEQWDCQLKKLKKIPNKEVQEVLRISFDGLEDTTQVIFLDIACFFKGKDKDHVIELLKSCNLYPEIGISTLIERTLITISHDNRLQMHDLIQEMGWHIVQQQSTKNPGDRSRLWLNEDIRDVLTKNKGTETIEGIVLDLSFEEDELNFNVDVFTKMTNLRVLEFCNMNMRWPYHFRNEESSAPCKIHLRGDFKFLSENLRYFMWDEYPLKSLPSNFDPRKLFNLKMRFSLLEQLWEGNMSFQNLMYMDLSHSQNLIKTPDLTRAPGLREINLKGCTSLVKVHPSIETLEKLSFLNLINCSKLEEVAKSFRKLTSLESVEFFGCSALRKLPDDLMMYSPNLDLFGCKKLEELPKGFSKLTPLKFLNLAGCSNLKELPKGIGKLTSLKTLNICGCAKLKKLPDDIGSLQRLKELMADGSGIQEVPRSINLLTGLEVLTLELRLPRQGLRLRSFLGFQSLYRMKLSECNIQERALPSDMSSLRKLKYLDLSGNNFITLPSLTPLTQLKILKLKSCKSLRSLTELPSDIDMVVASDCESLETFSCPRNAYAMSHFDFSNCGRLMENEESVNLKAILHRIQAIPPRFSYDELYWFNALVVGSSIPEWFIHRSVGNSIILKLPSNFPDFYHLAMGYCAVLGKENLSRWHSDHIWLGFTYIHEFYGQTPIERVNHLKFSLGGNVEEGPLVVKEWGIRLLYEDHHTGEEFDTVENIESDTEEEFDTVNATVPSPSPAFDEEGCWITVIKEHYCEPTIEGVYENEYLGPFHEECVMDAHFYINVEGYSVNVYDHVMSTSLTQYSNQFESEEKVVSRNLLASFVPDPNQSEIVESVTSTNLVASFVLDLNQFEVDRQSQPHFWDLVFKSAQDLACKLFPCFLTRR